jgi:soluble lytic murein transglycosylase
MPTIPVYQPNQIGPVQAVGERFQAANNNGGMFGALAEGLQSAGSAVMNHAVALDELRTQRSDTYSRKFTLTFKQEVAPLLTQYQSLLGENAIDQAAAVKEQIQKVYDNTLAQAGDDERTRRMLTERLADPFSSAQSSVLQHSVTQQREMARTTYRAEQAQAENDAAGSFNDPVVQRTHIAAGLSAIDDLARVEGWGDDQLRLERLGFTTKAHQGAIDQMLGRADPDIEMAMAYAEAHRDEMSTAAWTGVLKDLRAPIEFRQSNDDVARAMAMVKPPEVKEGGAAPVAGPVQDAFRSTASKLGISPRELAAIASFEGRLNPNVTGGDGGRYQGMFQFGPEERRKYGVSNKSTAEQQLAALVQFAEDRGYKPGMGWQKLYTTINAGNPHAPVTRRDSNGSQADHYRSIERDHFGKADAFLGGSDGETPREWDKDQVYNNLDQIAETERWSPERLERAKKRADDDIRRDEELKGREERAADQSALQAVAGLGAGFTSINQIPAAVREKMSVETRTRFEQTAQTNLARSQEIPANGADSMRLEIMRRTDPEAFARENLSSYVGKVTPGELQGLVLDQASALAAAAKPKPVIDTQSGITSAISHGQKYGGIKLDDKDFPTVFDTMQAILAPRAATGQPLTSTDYDTAFKAATRSVPTASTVFGFRSSGAVPVYDLTIDQISDNMKATIIRNWNGPGKPTDAQILSIARGMFATGKR